jgi:hypothetical protein
MNTLELTVKTAHLRAALLFAAVSDVRYYLNGINLRELNGKLVIQATDGHRAIRITTDTTVPEGFSAIITTLAAKAIVKSKESDQLTFTAKTVESLMQRQTWQLIDGRFPEVCAILPSSYDLPALSGYHNPLYIADAWRAVGLLKDKKGGALFDGALRMVSEPYDATTHSYKSGKALYKGKVNSDTVEIVIMPMPEGK